jgi:metal transporter CNNM
MEAEACEYLSPSCDPASFWTYLCVCLLLVCAAGMMAGLTMGLVSLDMLNVRILEMEGSDEEKRFAQKVRPVLERHHFLLVTLLVVNASANEALPIFLDKLVPEGVSIVLSVTCVLMFGEIIPSAVFTGPNQLRIAAALTPFVKVLMVVVSPIAYPISKVLDWWIGADHDAAQYKRNELKALVALQRESEVMRHSFAESHLMDYEGSFPRSSTNSSHSSVLMSPNTLRQQPLLKPEPDAEVDLEMELETPNTRKRRRHQTLACGTRLNVDEVTIIHGALDLSSKTVTEIMLPMSEIYMLEIDTKLDRNNMADILASGHSRIPVYEARKSNIVGLLLVKRLIVLDPDDARPIRDLVLRKPILVSPSGSCYSMLNEFQKGRSHIALITKDTELVTSCWR